MAQDIGAAHGPGSPTAEDGSSGTDRLSGAVPRRRFALVGLAACEWQDCPGGVGDAADSADPKACKATEVVIMQPVPSDRPVPAESYPTNPSGLPEVTRPGLLNWPTATISTCGSSLWAGGSGTPRCGCWATTALSPARRSRWSRALRRSSTSSTRATWRQPCTGTGCGWRTSATASRTRPRPHPDRWQLHLPDPVPRPGPVLVAPAHPGGLDPEQSGMMFGFTVARAQGATR